VSLIVTIDGALFFLLSLQDGRRLAEIVQARRRCRLLTSERRKLEARRDVLQARSTVADSAWDAVNEESALAANRFRALVRVSIQNKAADRQQGCTLESLIEDRLRLRAISDQSARKTS
jgi:hypothetical protein